MTDLCPQIKMFNARLHDAGLNNSNVFVFACEHVSLKQILEQITLMCFLLWTFQYFGIEADFQRS